MKKHITIRAFTGTSADYINKAAVSQANDLLMESGAVAFVRRGAAPDPFTAHGIRRPSRAEIAKAGSQAMKTLVPT